MRNHPLFHISLSGICPLQHELTTNWLRAVAGFVSPSPASLRTRQSVGCGPSALRAQRHTPWWALWMLASVASGGGGGGWRSFDVLRLDVHINMSRG